MGAECLYEYVAMSMPIFFPVTLWRFRCLPVVRGLDGTTPNCTAKFTASTYQVL